MNTGLFELLDQVGWRQAVSEHGAQVRSEIDKTGAIRTDVLAWDGQRLLLDTESIDAQGKRNLVSATWRFSENAIEFTRGEVDEELVSAEQIMRIRDERTQGMDRPDFYPAKSSTPAKRTPSGRLAL